MSVIESSAVARVERLYLSRVEAAVCAAFDTAAAAGLHAIRPQTPELFTDEGERRRRMIAALDRGMCILHTIRDAMAP